MGRLWVSSVFRCSHLARTFSSRIRKPILIEIHVNSLTKHMFIKRTSPAVLESGVRQFSEIIHQSISAVKFIQLALWATTICCKYRNAIRISGGLVLGFIEADLCNEICI